MSQANYIIICAGRTDELRSQSIEDKIFAASNCAAQVVAHIDVIHPGKLKDEDTKEIAELQHWMMDNMSIIPISEAKKKCKKMFDLLYELEKKFKGA